MLKKIYSKFGKVDLMSGTYNTIVCFEILRCLKCVDFDKYTTTVFLNLGGVGWNSKCGAEILCDWFWWSIHPKLWYFPNFKDLNIYYGYFYFILNFTNILLKFAFCH